jgi:ribonuclease P protein component
MTLKKNSEFRLVYRQGHQSAGRLLVLYARPNSLGENRLGITVSRKVGKAVTRNRVKRWIREICRLFTPEMEQGYDLVIVARAAAGLLERPGAFAALRDTIGALLAKQRLLTEGRG